ncbi:MAG: mechanosensitive ion channel [Phormidesmis sp. RL_2_1]|nr:mechanosensitive ion channel [Phormidesmis sp. RL_2_1]
MPDYHPSRNPQRIVRLVVVAVLSFTVAIALPFIAPRIILPTSMVADEQSAPVIVDGRAVFRVTDTATTTSASTRAATISLGLQNFAQQQQQPEIQVESIRDGNLATVWLYYPNAENPDTQFNFTVTADDTNGTLTAARQAQNWARELEQTFARSQWQRQDAYIQSHLWQILVVPIVAALAHWLVGLLWRGYLYHFLQSLMMEEEEGDHSQFTIVNLFLNATLMLFRLGIWIGALLYATDLFPDTRQFSYQIISQLTESFTNKTIPLGNEPISIVDIFRVLVLVLLVTVVAQLISNLLKQRILQETGINRGVQEAIAILLRYSLIFVGCIIVLQASGIDLSSLTLLASALGVGAGLGLQNIVKDIGSGLVLVFERPVQVGEFVQIGDKTGTVERIGARSAEIRTLDQVSVIVPNSKFLENEVVNWSHRNPISRIRIPIGVAYHSDPEQVQDLLLRVSAQHKDVLTTPPAIVLFLNFGDSALQFELLVWIDQPSRQFIIRSDLMFLLAKALRQEGIEIPFPQRDLHMHWQDLPDQHKND